MSCRHLSPADAILCLPRTPSGLKSLMLADPKDGGSQSPVGCAKDSWRTIETGDRGLGANRLPIPAPVVRKNSVRSRRAVLLHLSSAESRCGGLFPLDLHLDSGF
jgi:hypothetical protein